MLTMLCNAYTCACNIIARSWECNWPHVCVLCVLASGAKERSLEEPISSTTCSTHLRHIEEMANVGTKDVVDDDTRWHALAEAFKLSLGDCEPKLGHVIVGTAPLGASYVDVEVYRECI